MDLEHYKMLQDFEIALFCTYEIWILKEESTIFMSFPDIELSLLQLHQGKSRSHPYSTYKRQALRCIRKLFVYETYCVRHCQVRSELYLLCSLCEQASQLI